MTKRLLWNLSLAAAGAVFLAWATPARACGPECEKKHEALRAQGKDCDCPHRDAHHGTGKAEKKGAEPAAPETKEKKEGAPAPDRKAAAGAPAGAALAAGCNCGKGEKCACPKGECKCGKEKSDKPAEKPKASAGSTGGALAGDKPACNCEKGGKNCTCPKGECKCKNCHEGAKRAA